VLRQSKDEIEGQIGALGRRDAKSPANDYVRADWSFEDQAFE
jgi:hypothetical protein